MSVISTPTKLTVRCDGRPNGPCANHYEVANTQQAITEADDWLTRRGWRTRMDGIVQLHFCVHCSNRMHEFNPNMKANDPGKMRRYQIANARG